MPETAIPHGSFFLESYTYLDPEAQDEAPRSSRRKEILETIKTIILAVMVYALVNLTTVRVVVDGPSMRPTLVSGEWIIVNRLAYLATLPQRGDVIVFLPPTNAQTDDLIKRVVGLPGETVEVRSGAVYIGGELLSEPYVRGTTFPDGIWRLGSDQLFVLGDNRELSLDSRSFGPIPVSGVVGNALVIIWPPEEWGPLDWRSDGFSLIRWLVAGAGGA
jgi:signal peptidase I